MITRVQSATDGRLESEYDRSANRHEPEVHDPRRQHLSTESPTPSSDLLPEEYDPLYDARHEHNGVKIILNFSERIQTKGSRSSTAKMKVPGQGE
jgi:hypothetical protein